MKTAQTSLQTSSPKGNEEICRCPTEYTLPPCIGQSKQPGEEQGDRDLFVPASWVKVRKKESYARSEDLLAALKKMLRPFSTRNLYPIRDRTAREVFADLEHKLISGCSKFGVIYGKDGQNENDMYNNVTGSKQFEEFLDLMGEKIQMLGWTRYRGDFSTKASQDSRYTTYEGHEIMFHVSTYLPFQKITDATHQQWERKRFIGNDIVVIVFYEGTTPIEPSTFVSNFNHVFALVQPVTGEHGVPSYKLHMCNKKGVIQSQPLLPADCVFPRTSKEFRNFLLTKLVNSERCAMAAPQFRKANEKVRAEVFADLQQRFPRKTNYRRKEDQIECYNLPVLNPNNPNKSSGNGNVGGNPGGK